VNHHWTETPRALTDDEDRRFANECKSVLVPRIHAINLYRAATGATHSVALIWANKFLARHDLPATRAAPASQRLRGVANEIATLIVANGDAKVTADRILDHLHARRLLNLNEPGGYR
jgi:hypothetical protein